MKIKIWLFCFAFFFCCVSVCEAVSSGFSVYLNTETLFSQSAGWKKVVCQSTIYDNLSEWDAVNGRFTATVAGDYQFNYVVRIQASEPGYVLLAAYKNGNELILDNMNPAFTSYSQFSSGSLIFSTKLVVGDYIEIWCRSYAGDVYLGYQGSGYNSFSGHIFNEGGGETLDVTELWNLISFFGGLCVACAFVLSVEGMKI
jgi:hypothetical protein